MKRVINAQGVRKLKPATTIYLVYNGRPQELEPYTLIQYGAKKMLRDRNGDLMPVKDYQGSHYEVEV